MKVHLECSRRTFCSKGKNRHPPASERFSHPRACFCKEPLAGLGMKPVHRWRGPQLPLPACLPVLFSSIPLSLLPLCPALPPSVPSSLPPSFLSSLSWFTPWTVKNRTPTENSPDSEPCAALHAVVPATWKLRQEDFWSSDVQDRPGPHSKTPLLRQIAASMDGLHLTL